MNRGSPRPTPPRPTPLAGFNEAPIHESGKCCGARVTVAVVGIASMRPRFMNRGSLNTGDARAMADARFNEAPIHESGKSGRPISGYEYRIELQ